MAKSIDHMINNPERVFFSVSSDMVPMVRVIAYYINQLDQVVADSIALKIENTCKHHVSRYYKQLFVFNISLMPLHMSILSAAVSLDQGIVNMYR